MKKWIVALALIVATQGVVFASDQKGASTPLQRAVHIMQENAKAVGENAAIYDWNRVNLEVDRIVAAERTAQKALASEGAKSDQSKALSQTVREMRKARLNHDAEDLVKILAHLATLASDLLKK